MSDVLGAFGPALLGSRLKRLGERMQVSAAKVIVDAGLLTQPSHMPILAALDDRTMTIGQLVQAVGISQPGVTRAVSQLVDLGLVQSQQGEDQRQRSVSLTREGAAALTRAKVYVFPQVGDAVRSLIGDQLDAFMAQIAGVETALASTSLYELASRAGCESLKIREYSDDMAAHFYDINAEWINGMFHLEAADREVLENPRAKIIDVGGAILFVEARGLGIVGTCALYRSDAGAIELTKMGVRETARGLKAGDFLLTAIIERAKSMNADPLYLLSNSRCAAAVHLYEKHGFQHDACIMSRYGARYERCDVAMRYQPDGPAAG